MAGFGQRISWKENGICPPGYKMSFKVSLLQLATSAFRVDILQQTMYEISTGLITKVIAPPWLLNMDLTTGMRNTRVSFEHLEVCGDTIARVVSRQLLCQKYLLDMIHKGRSAEVKADRYDLLSGLLDASEDDVGSYEKLTDQEVLSVYRYVFHLVAVVLTSTSIGNIFIFLAAGHEVYCLRFAQLHLVNLVMQTTAHTLCFAFALLALYPDEQEKLYEHTKSILRDDDIPVRATFY